MTAPHTGPIHPVPRATLKAHVKQPHAGPDGHTRQLMSDAEGWSRDDLLATHRALHEPTDGMTLARRNAPGDASGASAGDLGERTGLSVGTPRHAEPGAVAERPAAHPTVPRPGPATRMTLHTGDCLDVMAAMEPESVDAVVTDPPYGISFMGKDWDGPGDIGDYPMRRNRAINTVNTGLSRQGGRQQQGLDFQRRQARDARAMQAWHTRWAAAALRVARPGAYLLAFGGTRTSHRLACAIEDAGWIIRDTLVWAYAQGFPKSRASLKPAWEPIVMARKPGPLRELAIDACRIGTGEGGDRDGEATASTRYGDRGIGLQPLPGPRGGDAAGRWPANVILTDPVFDGGWEGVVGGGEQQSPADYQRSVATLPSVTGWNPEPEGQTVPGYGDRGTYSRFFLIPKASRADREPLWPGLVEERTHGWSNGARSAIDEGEDRPTLRGSMNGHSRRRNSHPTVKPLALMRHLVRLVTPVGGLCLDPFLGSGTTALACEVEGFAWIGIEREPSYVAIAEARLAGVQRGLGLEVPA